jgi:hypothetical protein
VTSAPSAGPCSPSTGYNKFGGMWAFDQVLEQMFYFGWPVEHRRHFLPGCEPPSCFLQRILLTYARKTIGDEGIKVLPAAEPLRVGAGGLDARRVGRPDAVAGTDAHVTSAYRKSLVTAASLLFSNSDDADAAGVPPAPAPRAPRGSVPAFAQRTPAEKLLG